MKQRDPMQQQTQPAVPSRDRQEETIRCTGLLKFA